MSINSSDADWSLPFMVNLVNILVNTRMMKHPKYYITSVSMKPFYVDDYSTLNIYRPYSLCIKYSLNLNSTHHWSFQHCLQIRQFSPSVLKRWNYMYVLQHNTPTICEITNDHTNMTSVTFLKLISQI
jgi:hypothetical protein